MNLKQNVQTRSSINGFGRRRVDNISSKPESKMHTGKSTSGNFSNGANGGKSGGAVSPSRDRLIYVISYLIGHRVEVHVRNGSIISGIFHATNAEKDFAIVLKMAQVIKDGSVKGQKPDNIKKPMDLIIQAKDFVQIVAKDVALNIEEFSNAHPREKRKDLMIDSAISNSHHLEAERELERWIPDADDPEYPELEDLFDGTWNRSWDQFETNETLFGVKSTFDEELYTTKLDRGPRMRELEREATRIAREIEGEDTRDLHLAEERGVQFGEDFDLDEEIKYSAVQREREIEDHSVEEIQSSFLDAYNTETFGSSPGSTFPKSYSDISQSKFFEEAHASSTCSSVDAEAFTQIHSDRDVHSLGSNDHGIPSADIIAKKSPTIDDKSRLGEKQIKNQDREKNSLNESTGRTAPEKAQTSEEDAMESSADATGPSNTVTHDHSSSSQDKNTSELAMSVANGPANPSLHSGTSASSTSECNAAGSVSSGPDLSPSSSMGSLSSEKSTLKSTLNPNAKGFKLNPNAKSFTPSTSFRPPTPMAEGSFYYAGNLSAVPPMHNIPVGIGIGPSFGGHQPVFNPQAAQVPSPHAYIHPNGPMYGQQMILGQPRPVFYMPTYPPEMQYKGRNF